jgi:uncharacterized protein YoxC
MVEAQKTAETLQSQMSVIEDDMTHLKHREAKAIKDLQQVLALLVQNVLALLVQKYKY